MISPVIKDMIKIPDEVKDAAINGTLIFFIGAGVSRLAGLPGWYQWAQNILEQLREKGLMSCAEIEQLKTLEPRKQLSIAKIIAERKSSNLDFIKSLEQESEHDIYRLINKIGCACVTTNYDKLLKTDFPKDATLSNITNGTDTTSTEHIRVWGKEDLLEANLRTPGNIVHLHGCIDDPENMIITTGDYLSHYDNEFVKVFLTNLFDKYTVVFLGYGLEEIDIFEYILKKGQTKKESTRKRFYLEGFFGYQEELCKNLIDYYSVYFGVHLLGFKRDKNDFNQLTEILKKWSSELKVNSPALVDDLSFIDEVLNNG